MKFNRARIAALAMAALMGTSAMPFSVLAEEADRFSETEAAVVYDTSSAYQVDESSITFYFGDPSVDDYTVKYNMVPIGGDGEIIEKTTKATRENLEPATCKGEGKYATFRLVCTIEGKQYKSKETFEDTTSKKPEHSWKETDRIYVTEATCEEPGLVMVKYTCSNCGDTKEEPVETEALGHDFSKEGKTTYANLVNCEEKDGQIVAIDPTKEASYDIVKTMICVNDESHTEQKTETITIEPTKGVFSQVISTTNIKSGVEKGDRFDDQTQLPKEEDIELNDCSKAGSYELGFFYDGEKEPFSSDTVTVAPHHYKTVVKVEFNNKDDAAQCDVTYNADGTYTIKNKSCFKTVTYYEVEHCTAAGCKEKACDKKYVLANGETAHPGKEISRIEKTAEPNGKHAINVTVKKTINSLTEPIDYNKDLKKYTKKVDYVEVIPTTATCEEAGEAEVHYFCKICGELVESETKTIKIKALGHTADKAKNENIVEPTCSAEGHYDAVVYCKTCKKELSRKTVRIPRLAHTNELKVEVVDGKDVGTDDVDNTKKAEPVIRFDGKVVIDRYGKYIKAGDTSTEEIGSYVTKDFGFVTADLVTVCATCGEHEVVLNAAPTLKVDAVKYSEHDCQAGKITITASYKYNNKTISSTETFDYYESIDHYRGRTAHTPGQKVIENIVPATEETPGTQDEVYYCIICGDEISRRTVQIDEQGQIVPEDVELSFDDITMAIGKTRTISLDTESDGKVTYESSNPAVATVSSNGKIKAVAAGRTQITVKIEGTEYFNEAEDTFTVTVTPAPTVITKLVDEGAGTLRVFWRATAGVDGYQFRWAQNADYSGKQTSSAYATNNQRRYNLEAGTYYVSVRTFKVVDGEKIYSSWSGTKTQTLQKSLNGTSLVKVADKKNGKALIQWNAASGVEGYQISFADNASFKNARSASFKNVTSTTRAFTAGKTMYVRVRTFATGSDGLRYYSAWSAAKTVVTSK